MCWHFKESRYDPVQEEIDWRRPGFRRERILQIVGVVLACGGSAASRAGGLSTQELAHQLSQRVGDYLSDKSRQIVEKLAFSFILLSAAFFAGGLIRAGAASQAREPSDQCQSLYEWLSYYDRTDRSFPLRERSFDFQRAAWQEALKRPAAAVLQMGTNAVPCLLAWIESNTNHQSAGGTAYRARLAVVGFGILGAEARSACPQLARLARDSRQKGVAESAVEGLVNVGLAGVPEMISILTDTNALGREKVAEAIGGFGTNGLPALPALLRCVSDADLLVAVSAAVALTELPARQEVVLPALTNVLNDPRGMVRWGFVRSLSRRSPRPDVAAAALGHALRDPSAELRCQAISVLAELTPMPESVLPTLTNAVSDPDPEVRRSATNAIVRLSGSGHRFKQ